jgi:hypothetical protein
MFLDNFDQRFIDRFHRRSTFKQMFEYLEQFEKPIIVETGTTRNIGINGACSDGNATLMFEEYVKEKGGHVYTIDIDPEACEIVSEHTDPKYTTVICGDSLEVLPTLEVTPHLLYLDSCDLNVMTVDGMVQPTLGEQESAQHHLMELQKMIPKITSKTLVVVDDSPAIWNYGKGALIREYYQSKNIEPLFEHYQVGWVHGH